MIGLAFFSEVPSTKSVVEYLIDGPAFAQSPSDYVARDPSSSSPLRSRESFTVKCQLDVYRLIVGLFNDWSPLAISRLVVSVVVDSFQCVPLRTISHVGVELFKRISPLLAHCYPTIRIVTTLVGSGATSRFRHTPRTVCTARGFTVSSGRLTSAAVDVSGSHGGTSSGVLIPAIAET